MDILQNLEHTLPIILAPGMWLFLTALLLMLLPEKFRFSLLLTLPLIALWQVWSLETGVIWQFEWFGYQVQPLTVTPVSRLFGTVFALAAWAALLYSGRQSSLVEHCSVLGYAGSALGVIFAGDLLTLFVYWECMAITSTLVIWSGNTNAAKNAAQRYFIVHVLGGAILMLGIVGWLYLGRESTIISLTESLNATGIERLSAVCILIGVLINAGAPPLASWLPDAYPEASPGGMVALSAFTTKTAVYVLWNLFPGAEWLIWIGLYMVFYGIIYALLENDMRRILAFSIVNQVGFMVCGIGIGTELALNGAAAHAFTHIIYKALLLMSAGAVLFQTGERKCSNLGGLIHTMPFTAICGIVGALAISSFPLTSGFVSKSMVTSASGEQHLTIVWLFLAAASAGVFLHAGIKFPWFVFFQKDSGLRPKEPPLNMCIAMAIFAALCIIPGIWPATLYQILPIQVEYQPYDAVHVVAQIQLLLFSGLAFFVLLPLMKRTETLSLDWDWFYRALPVYIAKKSSRILDKLPKFSVYPAITRKLNAWLERHVHQANVGAWSTSLMVALCLFTYAIFVLFFYIV